MTISENNNIQFNQIQQNNVETNTGNTTKVALPAAGALANTPASTTVINSKDTTVPADVRPTVDKNGNPSLFPPGLKLDPDALAIILSDMKNKTVEITVAGINDTLGKMKVALKDKLTEKLKLMDEQFEKMRKAIKKQKAKGLGAMFGKIFAAVAMMVVAAAAIASVVATGGATTPLAIAAITLTIGLTTYAVADAAISIANVILAEQGKAPIPGMDKLLGQGIGKIFEAYGMNPKTAEMVGGYIGAGLMIALTITSIALTAGASASASVPVLITRAALVAQTVTGVAQGTTQIANGATDIQIGIIQKDIANVQAKMAEKDAVTGELQKRLDDLTKQIEDILKAIQAFLAISGEILSSQDDSAKAKIRNMA